MSEFVELDPKYLESSPTSPLPQQPKSSFNLYVVIAVFVISWAVIAYLLFSSRDKGPVDPDVDPIVVQNVEVVVDKANKEYLAKKAAINRLIAKEILEKKITNSGQLVTVMQSYQQQAYKLSNKPIDAMDESMIPDDFAGKEQMLHDYFMEKAKGYE